MNCPKCGARASVMKGVDMSWNERYRQYKCPKPKCKNVFFTIEFVAAETDDMKEEWSAAVKDKVAKYKGNQILKGKTK